MNSRFFLAALSLSAAANAHAAPIFIGLKASDCVNGVLPNAAVRDSVLAQEKVPASAAIAAALLEGRLGILARAKEEECIGQVCKGADLALADMHHHLLGLGDPDPTPPHGFAVSIDDKVAPPTADRPKEFLNGNWSWLVVRCTAAQAAQREPAASRPTPSDVPTAEIVLGKDEDDAGKDFAKRGFATIGLSSDREAHETAWDIEAYLGVSAPLLGLGGTIEVQPFASFQYHTQKKVDDLSFGGALLWYPGNSGYLVRLKGSWETDRHFRSSLWRADLGWTPPWLDVCERNSVPGDRYANCEITFVGDYEDVRDPGTKASLMDLKSFTRLGFDSRLIYGKSIGESFGFLVASTGFSFRENLGHADANVRLFTASLGLTPSEDSAWKISFDYTHGRDLTELTKQDKFVITLGFRH